MRNPLSRCDGITAPGLLEMLLHVAETCSMVAANERRHEKYFHQMYRYFSALTIRNVTETTTIRANDANTCNIIAGNERCHA